MSKKLCLLLTALSISTTLLANEVATPPLAPFTGRVTGNKVRLRAQPNLEGHVIRETRSGEMVGVVGESQDFYAVEAPRNTKGYIFRTFVLDKSVEGDNVNVRLFPDVDAPIIGKLSRGEQVDAVVSSVNNKWLEISVPSSLHFYIAKEYVENCGPFEMLATVEKRQHEASHHLSAAFHYAQSELQKSFEEIDLESITLKFSHVTSEYSDLQEIVEKAREFSTLTQENYLQKKIAFLESRAMPTRSITMEKASQEVLQKYGISHTAHMAEKATQTIGLAEAVAASSADKMAIWQPLEESIYHLWIAANGEKSMQEFYSEEELNANILTGTLEAYTRPVKNRPGDFILKKNNLPIAFLYSTRVDLEKMLGQEITLKAAPRPNNNFAFPAYYVLSVE